MKAEAQEILALAEQADSSEVAAPGSVSLLLFALAGLAAGVTPALEGVRLEPIEALRVE